MAFVFVIGAAFRRRTALARLLAAPLLLSLGFAPSSTESAVANGDTRTIALSNSHTNESGSFTYMVDGSYDSAALEKLNWFLRDWRLNEPTKMDPKLFDIVWEVYRESGSTQPIDVLSGYRSPQTNSMLRRRSRQVAKFSQHMEGKAIDAHFIDVDPATIRDVAMRVQAGGVGFYPTGATPWVHIDSGSVRYWPRMSRDALTRLFPDGKTVFIPADGQPMPGYEQARAEIEARGGDVLNARNTNSGLLSWLFGARGGGADDEEESGQGDVVTAGRGAGRANGAAVSVASAAVPSASAAVDPLAAAKRDLPRGATFMQPSEPAAPAPVVASLDSNAPGAPDATDQQGPIAAPFIAPLPPRRPADLAATDAPTPPPRPAEFASAPAPAQATGQPGAAERALVAALVERGRLPGVITRGVGAAPSDALALAEETAGPNPSEGSALLARAAALAAPLPPIAPTRNPARRAANPASTEVASDRPSETSTAPARTVAGAAPPAAPATRALALLSAGDSGPRPANPYGDLVYDAFKAAPAPRAADSLAGLRFSSP